MGYIKYASFTRLFGAFWGWVVSRSLNLSFHRVTSAANMSDGTSRGDLSEAQELRCQFVNPQFDQAYKSLRALKSELQRAVPVETWRSTSLQALARGWSSARQWLKGQASAEIESSCPVVASTDTSSLLAEAAWWSESLVFETNPPLPQVASRCSAYRPAFGRTAGSRTCPLGQNDRAKPVGRGGNCLKGESLLCSFPNDLVSEMQAEDLLPATCLSCGNQLWARAALPCDSHCLRCQESKAVQTSLAVELVKVNANAGFRLLQSWGGRLEFQNFGHFASGKKAAARQVIPGSAAGAADAPKPAPAKGVTSSLPAFPENASFTVLLIRGYCGCHSGWLPMF